MNSCDSLLHRMITFASIFLIILMYFQPYDFYLQSGKNFKPWDLSLFFLPSCEMTQIAVPRYHLVTTCSSPVGLFRKVQFKLCNGYRKLILLQEGAIWSESSRRKSLGKLHFAWEILQLSKMSIYIHVWFHRKMCSVLVNLTGIMVCNTV